MSTVSLVGDVLVGAVGLLHAFIFNLEALTWYRGSAKGFGVKPENYGVTATLAANQGFYNLVLAAGCVYSLVTGRFSDKLFFITAVFACGVIGFITTGSAKILRAQCLPTALALGALFYGNLQDKGAFDTTSAGIVGGAIAATVALSLFVKNRIAGDAAFHAKKSQK